MPKKRKNVEMHVVKSGDSGKKFVRYAEGAEMYSVGLHTFQAWAKDANAVYRIRGVVLVNLQLVEDYLEFFSKLCYFVLVLVHFYMDFAQFYYY